MTSPFDPTLATPATPEATSSEGDEAYCPACNRSYSLEELFCPTDGTRLIKLVAKPDSLIGRIFDNRYEIRGVLGDGGMGTVYRGWQVSVEREVAIKVIHPKLATIRSVAKRFLREARLSSRLQHPTIVSVFDFGQAEDGVLYIVMELLRGRPLMAELGHGQPLALARTIRIGAQICEALDVAHREGIVHRDLKPPNVMLLEGDRVKVLDFGLAKSFTADDTGITGTDALLGTPQYMPPEQILGKDVDHRADLYALGCLLYQMASGRPPFDRNLATNVLLSAHLHDPVPPPPVDVPPALASLIMRCLAKDPLQRPASAVLVRLALEAIGEGTSNVLLQPPAPSAHEEVPARRIPRWQLAIGAIAVGLGAGAIGAAVLRSHDAAPPVVMPVIDAAAPVAVPVIDAAAPPVNVPASIPPDAAPAILPDASVPRPAPAKNRARPPARPDAGAAMPDLELIPTH